METEYIPQIIGFKLQILQGRLGFKFNVPLNLFMKAGAHKSIAYEELKVRTVHLGTAVAQ